MCRHWLQHELTYTIQSQLMTALISLLAFHVLQECYIRLDPKKVTNSLNDNFTGRAFTRNAEGYGFVPVCWLHFYWSSNNGFHMNALFWIFYYLSMICERGFDLPIAKAYMLAFSTRYFSIRCSIASSKRLKVIAFTHRQWRVLFIKNLYTN